MSTCYNPSDKAPINHRPTILSFKVDDIQQAVETLAGRGVRFYPSAEMAILDVGPSLVATFLEPDGNWMQLSQRTAAAEDE